MNILAQDFNVKIQIDNKQHYWAFFTAYPDKQYIVLGTVTKHDDRWDTDGHVIYPSEHPEIYQEIETTISNWLWR